MHPLTTHVEYLGFSVMFDLILVLVLVSLWLEILEEVL